MTGGRENVSHQTENQNSQCLHTQYTSLMTLKQGNIVKLNCLFARTDPHPPTQWNGLVMQGSLKRGDKVP